MLKNITSDFKKYRRCLHSVWNDFTHRFDVDQDWDLCDLFADIGCSIFDIYIAEKFNIPQGLKAKQYQHRMSPVKEILVKPQKGVSGYCSDNINYWVEYDYISSNEYFYWVDFYDFNISDANRSFKYVLVQNTKGQHFIFDISKVSVFFNQKKFHLSTKK